MRSPRPRSGLAGAAVAASLALSLAGYVVANARGDTPGFVVALSVAAFVLALVGLVVAVLGRAWVWLALGVVALVVGAGMTLASAIAYDIEFGP